MRLSIVLLTLLTACSTATTNTAPSDSTPPTASEGTVATTVPNDDPVIASPTTSVEDALETTDLAIFIAALEAGLTDTKYEGTALSDPAVYIATGQLFCEELDAEADPALLLSDYLKILTEGDIGAADDDDLVVSGLLLGVSVEVMCPQHSTALSDAGF